MPIVLTLFLVLCCSPVTWPTPAWGDRPLVSVLVTAGLLALPLLRLLFAAGRALRLIHEPFRQSEALIPYGMLRGRIQIRLMMAFALALIWGGWGDTARSVFAQADGRLLPGAELLVVAPFLLSLLASWLIAYPVERAIRRAPRLPDYLLLQFRQQVALALLPLGLIVIEQGVVRFFPTLIEQGWFQFASGLGLIGLLALAPWLMRWLLGWRVMPDGPVRRRLLATARRLKLRFSDLLLWPTHGMTANAMVAGLLPRPRYVLMTDRLIYELSPDELDTVLGHEIGHVRHRHMTLYIFFIVASVTAMSGLLGLAERWSGPGSLWERSAASLGDWSSPLTMIGMAAYVLFAFGFISRRCEREADLFGCRAVSCGKPDCDGHGPGEVLESVDIATPPCPTSIATFCTALERVAVVNGMHRSKPGWFSSWQHATIAERVEFLERVRRDPAVAVAFGRRMRRFKVGLVVGLTATLMLIGWLSGSAG